MSGPVILQRDTRITPPERGYAMFGGCGNTSLALPTDLWRSMGSPDAIELRAVNR